MYFYMFNLYGYESSQRIYLLHGRSISEEEFGQMVEAVIEELKPTIIQEARDTKVFMNMWHRQKKDDHTYLFSTSEDAKNYMDHLDKEWQSSHEVMLMDGGQVVERIEQLLIQRYGFVKLQWAATYAKDEWTIIGETGPLNADDGAILRANGMLKQRNATLSKTTHNDAPIDNSEGSAGD